MASSFISGCFSSPSFSIDPTTPHPTTNVNDLHMYLQIVNILENWNITIVGNTNLLLVSGNNSFRMLNVNLENEFRLQVLPILRRRNVAVNATENNAAPFIQRHFRLYFKKTLFFNGLFFILEQNSNSIVTYDLINNRFRLFYHRKAILVDFAVDETNNYLYCIQAVNRHSIQIVQIKMMEKNSLHISRGKADLVLTFMTDNSRDNFVTVNSKMNTLSVLLPIKRKVYSMFFSIPEIHKKIERQTKRKLEKNKKTRSTSDQFGATSIGVVQKIVNWKYTIPSDCSIVGFSYIYNSSSIQVRCNKNFEIVTMFIDDAFATNFILTQSFNNSKFVIPWRESFGGEFYYFQFTDNDHNEINYFNIYTQSVNFSKFCMTKNQCYEYESPPQLLIGSFETEYINQFEINTILVKNFANFRGVESEHEDVVSKSIIENQTYVDEVDDNSDFEKFYHTPNYPNNIMFDILFICIGIFILGFALYVCYLMLKNLSRERRINLRNDVIEGVRLEMV